MASVTSAGIDISAEMASSSVPVSSWQAEARPSSPPISQARWRCRTRISSAKRTSRGGKTATKRWAWPVICTTMKGLNS